MAVKNTKRATLKDVAQAAGVSIASVSNVLNECGYVGIDTKISILAAIDKLGYRRNRAAKSLKTGEFPFVGLVLPNISNLFYTSLVESIMDECRAHNMAICLMSTKDQVEDEIACVNYLLSHDVMGIIWCAPRTETANIVEKIRTFPTVFIGRQLAEYDCIIADDFQGGYEIGKLALRHGHTKIGVITGPRNRDIVLKRHQGLEAALKGKADIVWQFESTFLKNTSEQILSTILQRDATFVVTPNDVSAFSIMKTLSERGLRIPQDVSFVGYDNSELCEFVQPSLTSVGQPRQSIAKDAVRCLLERAGNPNIPVKTIVKPVVFEIRDSVK